MSKARIVQFPTPEDVRVFLASIDSDALLAATSRFKGIALPEDQEACKRVYDWLRQIERGEWP